MSVKDPSLPLVHLELIQHAWAHRKWSWADEQGWRHTIVAPYAYIRSWIYRQTVITHGTGYESYLACPCCLRVPEVLPDYPWLLYYVGDDALDWISSRVYLQKSVDGITFTKNGISNPIITPPTGYTAVNAFSPIYDIYETVASRKYKALAQMRTTAGAWVCGYWFGSDYQTWTFQGTLALTAFTCNTSFFRVGNMYLALYTDTDMDIRLSAIRSDFGAFYDYGKVITRGLAGTWDANRVLEACLFAVPGTLFAYFRGDDANNTMRIGMASTPIGNPFRIWDKWLLNPIFEGSVGSWLGVTTPSLVQKDEYFSMYHTYVPSTGVWDIGRSTLVQ